jgi:hypothetical protein
VTTYLKVPYSAKAEAKAKGAPWDAESRKWFVPVGRKLEPFTSSLPDDPAELAKQDLAEAGKGVPCRSCSLVDRAAARGAVNAARLP